MRHLHALILILIVAGLFFAGPIFRGEIVFPHDNDAELGIPPARGGDRISNRKFSDQSSYYVPELQHQLHGRSAGWISTWNPHVELGRPTSHLAGISRAFWLTRGLAWLSGNPFRIYTGLVMFALTSTALFALLLFREEGLHPAASLAGALGIGFGVFAVYWATFALFVFTLAWTLAWMWLLRRMLRRPDLPTALGIAVVVQSLLLTGYPQQVVWNLGAVGTYGLYAAWARPVGGRGQLRSLAWVAAASAVGALAAAPVYADLALNAARSARLEVPAEFYSSVLPRFESLQDGVRFLLLLLDVSVFGNAVEPRQLANFHGISLTPLFAFGLAASFLGGGARRLWPLQLFVGLAALLTLWPAAYRFGVEYLGLSLSRWVPLAGALVPIAILCAHGFDAVLRGERGALALAVGLALLLAGSMTLARALGTSAFPWWGLASAVLGAAAVIGLAQTRWPPLLSLAALLVVALDARPLLLVRPMGQVHRDSPLAEMLRDLTADGSRYAWVGLSLLPPNQEALLGLRSIHTYNSLSWRGYQEWVRELSARGTNTFGRHFFAIENAEKLSPTALRRARVGVLLSSSRLDDTLAEPVAHLGWLWIYRPREEPQFAEQAEDYELRGGGRALLRDPVVSLEVKGSPVADDRIEVGLTAKSSPTLLRLSQQFHPQWRARSGARELECVVVDGFYQGVLIPPGVDSVELSFEPFVRWAWVPQALFLLAIPVAVIWQRWRSAGPEPASPG